MTEQPGQREIDAAIDRFAACRGPVGHHWVVQRPHPSDAAPQGYTARFICAVCEAKRRDIFDRATGKLVSQSYEYPPEYDIVGKHDAAWWRARWAAVTFGAVRPHGHNVIGIRRKRP